MATTFNTYDIGDLIRIRATFRDVDGNLADPDTVSVYIKSPDGPVEDVTADAVASGTGEWYVDYDTTGAESGVWHYRFVGTGNVQQSSDWGFILRRSEVLAT